MKNQEKEIKLDNNVTMIFTGNENKKKLDELLWYLIHHLCAGVWFVKTVR